MKKLCIYHGNCADGFGAAWVVRKALGEDAVEFFAGFYGKEPPDVTDREVIMVDFSYKRPVLEAMREKATSILILDHHKTAQADLDGFEGKPGHDVSTLFDMNRSGAMIAWDYFFPNVPAPSLIQHIQDRDLWLFKLEGTREIQASIFSYPYDFKVWDELMMTARSTLVTEGTAIERKHHKDIAELVGVSKRRMRIGGHDVPVANLPYTLSSDAGHLMGKGEPFAACYMDDPTGRTFSLRSSPDGVDVSEIAKAYGGGGHKNAAGFKVAIGWEGESA
jgi:oligoribonuclease NrnB/cAMP/cGMP phosphodiesterase (DHH superfamily)